jgi:hypothetical protein
MMGLAPLPNGWESLLYPVPIESLQGMATLSSCGKTGKLGSTLYNFRLKRDRRVPYRVTKVGLYVQLWSGSRSDVSFTHRQPWTHSLGLLSFL